MLPALLLALGLQQQPGTMPGGPPAAATDSTRAAMARTNAAVMRVEHDVAAYRGALGGEGDLPAAAERLRLSCQTLDTMAWLTHRTVCRHCAEGRLQQALDGYVGTLPRLRRAASDCATRIAQAAAGPDAAAGGLRRPFRAIARGLITAVVPYRRRLAAVRDAARHAGTPLGAATSDAAQSGGAAPRVPVEAQAAVAGGGGAPREGGAFTAGLAMPLFAGRGRDAALGYAGRFAHMLDSTIVLLVGTFQNASGEPVLGATSPEALSDLERGRWTRCRSLYWDLTTYPSALVTLRRALPANPRLELAAAQLDSAFQQDSAVAECDNVASMITAPARWTPWEAQYTTAARRFYRGFYDQIRAVHERDRALVFALNAAVAPDRRIRMPAGLPPNPPYAGAAPR